MQDKVSEKSIQREQDRFMQEQARSWLFDHTLWHFERIDTTTIAPERYEGTLGMWIALGDALPAQTTGIVLGLRKEAQWDVLTSQTFQKNGHSPEIIQDRLQSLLVALHSQTDPLWSSDKEDV